MIPPNNPTVEHLATRGFKCELGQHYPGFVGYYCKFHRSLSELHPVRWDNCGHGMTPEEAIEEAAMLVGPNPRPVTPEKWFKARYHWTEIVELMEELGWEFESQRVPDCIQARFKADGTSRKIGEGANIQEAVEQALAHAVGMSCGKQGCSRAAVTEGYSGNLKVKSCEQHAVELG